MSYEFSETYLQREGWRKSTPLFPTVSASRAGLLGVVMLVLTSAFAGDARAQTDTADCSPKLVRAVTHFPPDAQQFYGDGVVELGVEVDRSGRVVSAKVKNARAAGKLFEAARASAYREWLFDVTGCRAFPSRATVRVEYQRPPAYTFSASRARSRDLAAALPANADCERNAVPRFGGDTVVSCLVSSQPNAATNEAGRTPDSTARVSIAPKDRVADATLGRGQEE